MAIILVLKPIINTMNIISCLLLNVEMTFFGLLKEDIALIDLAFKNKSATNKIRNTIKINSRNKISRKG
jgi:hypothetical protein